MRARSSILSDGTVTLRAWEPEDAAVVFEACQDPLIARFVPIPLPYTMDVAVNFVASSRTALDGDTERPFAIVDAVTGRVLGAIARHGPWGHRAQFGYWLAPDARGRGVATRALRLITAWTFDTTHVIRCELYTHPDNDASGRVATRAGFTFEGVRRAWDLDRDGNPEDAVFYVLLRTDRDRA